MVLRAGDQVDRYTLEEMIGEGGQAQVWRARDRYAPTRALALKLVDLADSDPVHVERVRREARHLARLSHPALPTCHALVEDLRLGLLAIALDLVEGPSLTEALSSQGLSEAERRVVLRQVAAGLACMHSAGVIHRDVKPDNIILAPDFRLLPDRPGAVKLIDLGIAIQSGNPSPLTVIGHIIGTAEYLAPEQLDPRYHQAIGSTPAADVFALGVLGWQLIYGAHPTGLPEGSSLEAYALAYRRADAQAVWPDPVRHDTIDQALRRCLAVRARDRLPTAVEASAMLFALDGVPPPSVGAPSQPDGRFSSIPDGRLSSLPPTSIDLRPASIPHGMPSHAADTIHDGPAFHVPDDPGSSTLAASPLGHSTVPPSAGYAGPPSGHAAPPSGYAASPAGHSATPPPVGYSAAPPSALGSAPVPAAIFAHPASLSQPPPAATVMQTVPRPDVFGGMQPGYQSTHPQGSAGATELAPRFAPLAVPRPAALEPSRPAAPLVVPSGSRGSSHSLASPQEAAPEPMKKRSIFLYIVAFVVIGLGAGAVAILALFAFVMLRLAR